MLLHHCLWLIAKFVFLMHYNDKLSFSGGGLLFVSTSNLQGKWYTEKKESPRFTGICLELTPYNYIMFSLSVSLQFTIVCPCEFQHLTAHSCRIKNKERWSAFVLSLKILSLPMENYFVYILCCTAVHLHSPFTLTFKTAKSIYFNCVADLI